MGVRTREIRPPTRLYQELGSQHQQILEEAAAVSVDKATTGAGNQVRTTIRARGLGRLANAVGTTSSYKKGKRRGRNSWGAIFARGGDESLAGGALESYSRGSNIQPIKGPWLWFQTDALKRRVGRRRMTPERYTQSGSPLGPLLFRRKNARVAELFVKGVTLTAKGKARRPGPRSKVPTTIIVLFVGIPNTQRMKRFDKEEIVSLYGGLVPAYMIDEVAGAVRRRRALAA